MTESELHALRKLRRTLGNQYALLEYLEEAVPLQAISSESASVRASRKLLQDPYAHLDDGGLVERKTEPDLGPQRRYSTDEVEALAREVQLRLWHERRSRESMVDPVLLLDPEEALAQLGFRCVLEEGLGSFLGKGKSIEVAGLIDQPARTVRLSRQFSRDKRLYTAAHELGHAVLHSSTLVVHRDRPLDGTRVSRDPLEREADHFAAAFLMPARLVKSRFKRSFGLESFSLTDDVAFAIGGLSIEEFRRLYPTRHHVARLLASAILFDGRRLPSLASQFRVSIGAMAIRLEELKLVGDPAISFK
jgi:Zn-dependent peptidase ImmA (M78 family)